MSKYAVTMTVTGKTVNEVSSKMMVAAYSLDFDIEDLKVERIQENVTKLLSETTGVEDNDPAAEFQFPHIKEVVDGLNKKKRAL